MKLEEYARYDAVGLAEIVRSGAVSPTEVIEAAIAAVERLNPRLNAVVLTDFEWARATAGKVDRPAPLAGLPFLVKDVDVFVAEWPTTYSSRFFANAALRPDSEIVRRWRAAGLVFLGKSNTPEFAADFATEPSWRGATLNPWNPAVTVGGSSGGAAAAVASGMVPAAHGTDVGGSIRIPAACCGLFGLKPTRGLNPVGPYYPEMGAGLNCEHVLTRSVRDSAALLDATAGPETGGRYHVVPPVPSYLAALTRPPARQRIALVTGAPDGAAVDPEIIAKTEAAGALLEALGHTVIACDFPPEAATGYNSTLLWMMDIAIEIQSRAKAIGRRPRPDEMEPLSHAILEQMERLPASDYVKARLQVHEAAVALARHFAEFDLVLTPSLATLPPALGIIDSHSANFDYETWANAGYGFAPFSEIFNVTGQPAASLPMFQSASGLPIGIQLVGRQGDDHNLLALAAQIETECKWLERHPPIWLGRAAS
jgi:amidase